MSSRLSKTYVINRDCDVERLQGFSEMMKQCNWDFSRFPAIVNPLTEDQEALRDKYAPVRKHSDAVSNCTLSHVSIWEKALEHDRVAIFEDDARTLNPHPSIFEPLERFYRHLEKEGLEEPDVLYLGKCFAPCSKMEPVFENIYRTDNPWCAHAYILTRRGARVLVDYKEYEEAPDHVLAHACRAGKITAMVFHPSLFFQDTRLGSLLRPDAVAIRNNCDCSEYVEGTSASNSVTTSMWVAWALVILLVIALVITLFFLFRKK